MSTATANPPATNGSNTPRHAAASGARSFSLVRAIRQIAEDRELDSLEGEIHQELALQAKNQGREQHPSPPQSWSRGGGSGFWVPLDALVEKRDLTSTSGAGALLTPVHFGRLVDVLRQKSLVLSMGAQLLDDFEGSTVRLPKKTSTSVAYWISEGNAPVESNPVIESLAFTGHTVGAFTDVSRKSLITSSGETQRYTIADLVGSLSTAVDLAAIAGTGADNQPEGLLTNTDVPTVALGTDGATPTYATLVELERLVAADSADIGRLAWLASVNTRAKLRKAEKASGSGMVWDDANAPLGYPGFASKQMPDDLEKGSGTALGSLLFGDWSSLLVGAWGSIYILVDRFTFATSGGVRIIALWDVDIKVAHPESFRKVTDIVTT